MNEYMRFNVCGTVTQVQEMCTLKGGSFVQVYVAKDVAGGKAGSVLRIQFYDAGQMELALLLKRGDRVFVNGRIHGWMNEGYMNSVFYGDLLLPSDAAMERVVREHGPLGGRVSDKFRGPAGQQEDADFDF